MQAGDLLAIGAWLVAVLTLLALAYEPWRRNRRRFKVMLTARATPFLAQLVPRDGGNVWLHPHLLLKDAPFVFAVFLVFQLVLRRRFMRAARPDRRETEPGRR